MIKKIFNIFKKEKKPKVIWWTTVDGLEKVVPVLPAKEVIPDWWKTTNKLLDKTDKGTIKNCPSFQEFFYEGYVMPLWTDVLLNVEKDVCEWKTPDITFSFDFHSDRQYKDLLPHYAQKDIKAILKPNCPWRLKTPDGYSVLQLPMSYHFNPLFEVLSGVIWTDIYHEINQQMVIKQSGEHFIKRGTPLCVYIPYKREKFDYEIQSPNQQNTKWLQNTIAIARTKFRNGYKIEQSKIKKCPYS